MLSTRRSLAHRMGEGWGEGSALFHVLHSVSLARPMGEGSSGKAPYSTTITL
jgi:hypothetical protein